MRTDRLLSALGLCGKAGKLVFGTPAVCEELAKKMKPFLVVSAHDNSENTEKRLCDKCTFYGVPLKQIAAGGEEIAHAVGKTGHIAAVAVTDAGFFRLLSGILEENNH